MGGGRGGVATTRHCVPPPVFIRVTPIEHSLRPAFDIKSRAEGRAGRSTDQISTSGEREGGEREGGGFNWF